MAGRGGRQQVKVKIIMTQFVQTDAQSFKSVVQRLTGRDSTAPAAAAMRTPPLMGEGFDNGGKKAPAKPKEISSVDENYQLEDMERMFLELPSFDEFLSFGVE